MIDGAFEATEYDGAAMRRQLRELLDNWWRVENQEDKAAIDDATARAAMRVHVASVESEQISQAVAVREEFSGHRYSYEPRRHVLLVDALETATHEDLDSMLSSLLDALDAPVRLPEYDVASEHDVAPEADEPADTRRSRFDQDPSMSNSPVPTLPPPTIPQARADSLNDESAGPQEAFDHFWESLVGGRAGTREWVFVQVLFPAVAVIAVLALVLAVAG
jgi:hypothetical protein